MRGFSGGGLSRPAMSSFQGVRSGNPGFNRASGYHDLSGFPSRYRAMGSTFQPHAPGNSRPSLSPPLTLNTTNRSAYLQQGAGRGTNPAWNGQENNLQPDRRGGNNLNFYYGGRNGGAVYKNGNWSFWWHGGGYACNRFPYFYANCFPVFFNQGFWDASLFYPIVDDYVTIDPVYPALNAYQGLDAPVQLDASNATASSSNYSVTGMVEKMLADAGYYAGPLDGKISQQFREAVARFQTDHNLPPTGVINEALLKNLGLL